MTFEIPNDDPELEGLINNGKFNLEFIFLIIKSENITKSKNVLNNVEIFRFDNDNNFINKIIAHGNYTEINTTTVIPSPRTSDRVPFGTGRAILDALNHKKDLSLTYDFSTFRVIRNWVEQILVYKMYNYSSFHPFVQSFLSEEDWNKKIDSISKNTSSEKKFNNRFFQVFNPFWVLKYVHHIRKNHVKDSSLLENTNALFSEFGFSKSNPKAFKNRSKNRSRSQCRSFIYF